jgi:hypothetical protein
LRKSIPFLVLALLLAGISAGAWYYSKLHSPVLQGADSNTIAEDSFFLKKQQHFAGRLKSYAVANKCNSRICFLIDMSISSGKKRFFVYDIEKNTGIASGLVTHGRCNEPWLKGRKYSNAEGSGCSSLGLYKVGVKYNGRFGTAYKLHGLDSTNSNAFRRFVVLHEMDCIPEEETFPFPVCQSDGCPAVAHSFFKRLQEVITASADPVLLYIYE